MYDTTDPENPVEIQEFQLSGVGNTFQLSLSRDDRNLYVLSPRAELSIPAGEANVLHTLAIDHDGKLSETLAVIPFASAAHVRPRGIAAVSIR